jgi:FkbM family methyltransferase
MRKLTHNPYSKANLTWFDIKRLKHLPAGPERKHLLNGHQIFFSSPQEFLHAASEIFVAEIYDVNLPKDAYVLDCGANIGLGSIYLKSRYPDAEIIAFEPDEKSYALLTKNIRSCGFQNIKLLKKAVWKEDARLQFSNQGNMGSRIETAGDKSTIEVEAVSLGKFITRKVDFLKLDIEGAEYEVLKSIKSQLGHVQNMFVEYHGKFSENVKLEEIFRILTDAGFWYYIKEATSVYDKPFQYRQTAAEKTFDVQLNIFCFRNTAT